MGLEVEMGHHEVALGQHEIDFRFADALKTADNVLTLKYTVKAIAAQHGLTGLLHAQAGLRDQWLRHALPPVAVRRAGQEPVLRCQRRYASLEAGDAPSSPGNLLHARGLAAVVAPTVNSYKRLVPGYEAPVYIGWAQQNRSALIRIPRFTEGREKAVRAELRFPDPSSNPYLAFAAILAAALDGIDKNLTPPAPLNNINLYHLTPKERKKLGVKELPGSLAEALTELDKDEIVKSALGETIYDAFTRAKWAEWDDFRLRVSDYEIERYLEAA